jgi:DNA invertase Pin-like site-specific DNA recombinase
MAHQPDKIALPTSTCAIYTRQSADRKSDFTSCQAQFEACYCYLKSQTGLGWRWIDERFDDEEYSGVTLDRPALQRLLRMIYVGKVHHVLIHRLDRLSRNIIDCTALLHKFRQRCIDLVIVSTPELGSSATDVFMLNILSAFAEFEREMIRTRIAEARAVLKQHGRRVGGAVPYGYQTDPYTKQLIVEPREAHHIQAMFKMAADGKTPSNIARAINQAWLANQRTHCTKDRKGFWWKFMDSQTSLWPHSLIPFIWASSLKAKADDPAYTKPSFRKTFLNRFTAI